MTIEQIEELIASLTEQLAKAQEELKEAKARPVTDDVSKANIWAIYEANRGAYKLPPQLELEGNEEWYGPKGNWGWDGEGGFFFKPLLNWREKFQNGNRVERYAAKSEPNFHYKYVALPPEFPTVDGYEQWVKDNHNEGSRKRIIWGGFMKSGFKAKPVYADFDFDPGIFNNQDRRVPDKDTYLPQYKVIWGGSKRKGEEDIDVLNRAREAFEKHWIGAYGASKARDAAKWKVRALDRAYAALGNDSTKQAQFIEENEGYEPKE